MIYLDHNATTPVHPEVQRTIGEFLGHAYGNPSSIHALGRVARQVIWTASKRTRIDRRLRVLYMRLETGQISEAEFDREEGPLLDRLDQLEAAGGDDEEEGEEDEG